jgi:hypothetical protein
MKGFQVETAKGEVIRFHYYLEVAPVTSKAFAEQLPFSRSFMHARVSGQEIWIDDAPVLDIIQENASVFVNPGEVVIGPLMPKRSKVGKCMGILYGDGHLLDCSNIFAKVFDEDLPRLKALGESIWKEGVQELFFKPLG